MTNDPHQAANRLAETMASVMTSVEPISETALGFRKRLEAEGWEPAQAQVIAAELHVQLIRFLFNSLTKARARK